MMKLKKHLSFSSLRQSLSVCFDEIEEYRQENKINYSIHDAMMSGFACMYFQDPSLLQFQQRLEKTTQRNNLRTLFRVAQIPEVTQMRRVIDEVNSEAMLHYLTVHAELLAHYGNIVFYAQVILQ